MKSKIIVVLILALSITITACQEKKTVSVEKATKEVITTSETSTNEAQAKKENEKESDVTITYEDKSSESKDKNGNLLLTVTGNIPVIMIKGNQEASDKINAYYKESQNKQNETIKQYIDYAKDYLSTVGDKELSYWNGYGLGQTYRSARVDNEVISIVEESYEYAGGAHPNTTRSAQNFDTKTGELLTLKDVFTDVEKGIAFVNEYLLKQMKASKEQDGFFEGYESSIKDILTEDTWYLSEEGFVVITNVYIVSPYAAGIKEYVIPYSEFPYLMEKYK